MDRLFTLLTSCEERRLSEYEQIASWTFIDAGNRSAAYQTLLAKGLTRSLVAVRAQGSSARTAGYTLLQLLFGLLTSGGFDRLLNGPTNDVWLTPWVDYLQRQGVIFQNGVTVKALQAAGGAIAGVTLERQEQVEQIQADYYICAMPIEVMTGLVDEQLKTLAPSLANLGRLRIAWMNGIQFYLAKDVPLEYGHSLYADSPWAITSVSQRQFWNRENLASYGSGNVVGILSVDISDWETPGIVYAKAAMQCTAAEIENEVWEELKVHLNADCRIIRSGWTADCNPKKLTSFPLLRPISLRSAGPMPTSGGIHSRDVQHIMQPDQR